MRWTSLYVSLFLVAAAASSAQAGDFVDTRLNFTIVNENVLVKPGETNPSVPGWRIGQPTQLGILFFDNYDTRYTGYENLTHLVIHKVMNTSRVTAEGAYVLRLLQFTDVNLSSIDDGSYIRLQFWFDKSRRKKTNIALTAFPLNADRMRLGYSYRITWGGSPIFFKYNPDLPIGASAFVTNTNPSPGLKLQLSDERYYVYVGFKTSVLLNRNPNVNEQVAVYGLMGGFGVDLVPQHLRLEGVAGFFDRGTNPLFYGTATGPGQGFTDYPVQTFGGTVQLSAFWGVSPTTSLDLTLYKNDQLTSANRYFTRPSYTPGLSFLVSTEFTALGATLQNADKPGSTTIQNAFAGDVNLRLQSGYFRFKTDIEARSLSYILINQPSLVPYQDFPGTATQTPEIFASAGGDYFLERAGLTLGLSAGVMSPATFTPPAGQPILGQLAGNAGGTTAVSTTIVVRNEGDLSILPTGQTAAPIFATKVEIREDFLEWFAGIVQVLYQYDANQTILTKASDGTSQRVFSQPNRLGFTFTLQARY